MSAIHQVNVQGENGTTPAFVSLPPPPRPPNGVVMLIEGDMINDEDLVQGPLAGLVQPSDHVRMLQQKFPSDAVIVVMPSRLASDSFACFDNMLPATTLTGEPLGYKPNIRKASSHLAALLQQASPGLLGLPCQLLGFSKGGVVLNQVLAEMAAHEDELQGAAGGPASAASSSSATPQAGTGPQSAPGPSFLDNLTHIHYVDAGLNGRGVHLTDARLIKSLGSRHQRRPLEVHFHGSPRQWQDRQRVWIRAEKELSASLMRGAGLPVREQLYFEGQAPSLKQHFSVIQALQVGP